MTEEKLSAVGIAAHIAQDPTLRVVAQAVRMTSYVGQKRRDPFSGWCYVPWEYLDALAEALRTAGIEPNAANLGTEARDKTEEARRRSADKTAATWAAAREEVQE